MSTKPGTAAARSDSHWDSLRAALSRISAEVEHLAARIGTTEDGWLKLATRNPERLRLVQEWRHLQRAKRELILSCRACEEMQL